LGNNKPTSTGRIPYRPCYVPLTFYKIEDPLELIRTNIICRAKICSCKCFWKQGFQ